MRTHTQLQIFFTAVMMAICTLTALAPWTASAQLSSTSQPKRMVASSVAEIGQGHAPNLMNANLPLFLPAVTYATGSGSLNTGTNTVVVADVNGDGKRDIIISNESAGFGGRGSVSVLLGNGDGTFKDAVAYDSGGSAATSVAVADVNGDHKPDIVVAHCGLVGGPDCDSGAFVGVLLGRGDGTFGLPLLYASGGFGALSLGVADLNRDGKPDVVVTNNSADGFTGEGNVGILLGNGDGTFQTAVAYDSGGQSAISVAIADVNRDGKPDVLLSDLCGIPNEGCTSKGVVGVLLGNGDGTFQPVVVYGSGDFEADSIAVEDVDGDGIPDLLVANSGSNTVGVLLGNGDGTFRPVVTYGSGFGAAWGIAIGDVNKDGKPDVIVTHFFDGTIGVLLGNGDGTFQPAITFDSGGSSPGSVAVADVNGNNLPDLIVNECAVSGCANGDLVGVLLHVGTTPTTTTLTSAPNPSFFGQLVKFTATVASDSGNPGGSVMFFDNSTALGSANLVDGKGSFSFSALAAGSHSITAVYQGSLKFNSSASTPLQQVVNHAIASTSTAVVSSLNPSIHGQAVTFTATVSSTGGTPPNGETVTFFNNSNVLGTARLNSGAASIATSWLPAGIFTITALYSGDANFAASTSPGLRQSVDTKSQFATATTLVSSLNPSIFGQKVTWTATVTTFGSVPPTGNVRFIWGSYTIGSATLSSSGVATLTRSDLNANSYPLTAVYFGDTDNGPSASAILNQVVTQAASSAKLTSSPNPSVLGQAVIFTATITSPTVTPKGPVSFTAGKTVLGTAQLSGGKATLTISSLAVGSTKVTATFNGDSDIAKSSASVIQTVQ